MPAAATLRRCRLSIAAAADELITPLIDTPLADAAATLVFR